MLSVTAILNGNSIIANAMRSDEMPSFTAAIIQRHKIMFPSHITGKMITAMISLTTEKLLRLKGKVWDQLAEGETVWLVTQGEWRLYYETVLSQNPILRHGKKIDIRHPSSLGSAKLKEFIAYFFDGTTPVDVMQNLTTSPAKNRLSSPILSTVQSAPLNISTSSPGGDNRKDLSPLKMSFELQQVSKIDDEVEPNVLSMDASPRASLVAPNVAPQHDGQSLVVHKKHTEEIAMSASASTLSQASRALSDLSLLEYEKQSVDNKVKQTK